MFDHVVEGMFQRALGKRLPSTAREELKRAGLDLDRPLRPAYPLADYFRFLEIAGRALYPTLTVPQAMFELGTCFLDGYLDTLMGKAIINLARLLGPARALRRSSRTWRQGNNFTEVEVIERDARTFELRFNLVGPYAEHTQGALTGALRINEGLDVKVEIIGREGQGATYLVTWNDKGDRDR